MVWAALTVTWSGESLKNLRGLTSKDQIQIIGAVEAYAATGVGDCKKLQGQDGYRLPVRSRRAFLVISWTAQTLLVTAVIKRGDAY